MRILGIETSCDETAAAVVDDGRVVLSNIVASQFDLHGPFGGVVPELAARAHAEKISAIIDEALRSANAPSESIDGISVVNRPGLVGALLVGISAAKGLALAWGRPLAAVDHIHGHVYASALAGFTRYPHVSLVVSGGHTSLYKVDGPREIRVLGQTADDAAGEAFDKVAKMLELGFPGGPALAKLADSAPIAGLNLFEAALASLNTPDGRNSRDFSFSGLKTAVYYHLRGTTRGRGPLRVLDAAEKAAVAASFQDAACRILIEKTFNAVRQTGIRAVAVTGGVACNRRLRELFAERARREQTELCFPPPQFCTDNAAMSAGLAYHLLKDGDVAPLDLDADPTPKRA